MKSPDSTSSLSRQARQFAKALANADARVVFAESCTAGMISAELAKIPGISQWLCGSAVVYRDATKIDWLGVSLRDLKTYTAVSFAIARQMAVSVLRKTPEANWSASVTGYLGPDAPAGRDGLVYIGIARRTGSRIRCLAVWELFLDQRSRKARQREATRHVLGALLEQLK